MNGRRLSAFALACLIGLFVPACGIVGPEGSSREDAESAFSAEESVPAPLCPVKAEIDARWGEPVDASADYGNLLLDRSYTVDRPWNPDYSGTAKTLSDGIVPREFNHYSWVGMDVGQTEIEFDLEEVKDNIGGFRAVFLYIPDYAIQLPQYVEISVSEDGENYFTAATLYSPTDITVESDVFDFDFRTSRLLRARYIRFKIRINRGIAFLGEVEARGYGNERDDSLDWTDLYPPFELPSEAPVFREDGDGAEINLAREDGVTVCPRAYSTVQKRYAGDAENPTDTDRLHDGVTETVPDWTSEKSFRMTRGDGRDLLFDLGYVACVSRFAADMLLIPSWGVQICDRIGVSVSVDGKEWQAVAVMENPSPESEANAVVRFSALADRPYKARYVNFSFLIKTHAAFSEIEIYGTRTVTPDAAEPSAEATDQALPLPNRFPTENVMGLEGVRNILCTYLCDTSANCGDASAMLTADGYLDLIAYRRDGAVRDVLFDHVAVTPHSLFAPAGDKEVLAGWMPYFDAQFSPGRGLEAISAAAETLGKAIGKTDYKEGVFLSVLRPSLPSGGSVEFGDVDGDGKPEKRDSLEDRKKILRWEVDMQLRRLAEIDAPHIRMCGFYWHAESLILSDPDEVELVMYATSYIHSKGYPVFWIPYYEATGYDRWKEMGFDFACLQPNYAFMSDDDPDRLETAAAKAKLHGMSVEIELNSTKSPESVKRYRAYLAAGKKLGYMEATKVYYLGGIPSDLLTALSSGSEDTRRIYDETYEYATKRIPDGFPAESQNAAGSAEALVLSGEAGRKLTGTIRFDGAEGAHLVITEMPLYGTVRLFENGNVNYTPAKGFYGEDSFFVAVRTGETVGPETRINVRVGYVPPEE